AAVEKAGYQASLPEPAVPPATSSDAPAEAGARGQPASDLAQDELKRKALVSLGIGLVLMTLMYVPLNLDLALLAPVLLIAATVVQFWAGRIFYRAAWAAASHGST